MPDSFRCRLHLLEQSGFRAWKLSPLIENWPIPDQIRRPAGNITHYRTLSHSAQRDIPALAPVPDPDTAVLGRPVRHGKIKFRCKVAAVLVESWPTGT